LFFVFRAATHSPFPQFLQTFGSATPTRRDLGRSSCSSFCDSWPGAGVWWKGGQPAFSTAGYLRWP